MFAFYGIIFCLIGGLLALLCRYLWSLTLPKNRRQYEFYVAKKLRKEGWENVKVQRGTKDGGKDIVSYLDGQKWIVQVKKYKGKVGPLHVSATAIAGARYKAKAMIVTSSGFTKEALIYARIAKVTLRVMST